MSAPSVSIGLPVWNGENYLRECLGSLRAQTYPELEIVISDNGSTDATEEICREAAAEDARIRYHREPSNRGAAWNYNNAFALARGEYFSWAAHDDLRTPDHTEACMERYAAAGPEVVLVYPQTTFIAADGHELGPDRDQMATSAPQPWVRLSRTLMSLNMASPVFGVARRSALERTRLIDSFTASDYVLLVELALLGAIEEVPGRRFLRRIHPASSREVNRSRSSVTAWFDPDAPTPRLLTDRQRLLVEYSRSVRRLVPSAGDRAVCLAAIPSVLAWRRARVVGGRWKAQLRERELRRG